MSNDENSPTKNGPAKDSPTKDNSTKNNPSQDHQSQDNPPKGNQPSRSSEGAKKNTNNSSKSADGGRSDSRPKDMFVAKSMPKLEGAKTKRRGLPAFIIAGLVLIALGLSLWVGYQQYHFNQAWAEQKAQLTDYQNKVNDTLTQQKQTVNQAVSASQSVLQGINQTQLQVNQMAEKQRQFQDLLLTSQERIKNLSGRQKQDWLLAEAAFLIRAAQLQLVLQKDKSTAIQLLKTADRRVIEIADSDLISVREAIAQDISDLNLIIDADITGISVSINTLIKQIPTLEIAAFEYSSVQQSAKNQSNGQLNSSGGAIFSQIYDKFLNDFVVIKEHDQAVKPLMTPKQRINLNSNIQLALQQAQIAAFRSEQVLYRQNLDNAIDWISTYFVDNAARKEILRQLQLLADELVDIRYPQRLASDKALKRLSQQQLYQWLGKDLEQESKSNSASGQVLENTLSPSEQSSEASEADNSPKAPTEAKP